MRNTAPLRRRALLAATAALAATLPLRAQGQYPDRSITIIVCFAPGGSTDVSARILAAGISEYLGKSVVVENRGGAGGNIGIGAVARAAADGYTLLVASSVFVVNPSLYRTKPFDPVRDFTPIATLGASPNVLGVRAELGINSFAELVQRVRAQPERFNCALPGIGTTPHLAAEVMKLRAGMPMQLVPFSGAGPAAQAIISGTTELIVVSQGGQVETAYRQGRIKLLAQTGPGRDPAMPEVPTIRELGIADAESETFNALFAPAGTPATVVAKLAEASLDVLRRPDTAMRYRTAGLRVLGEGPEQLRDRVAREVPIWRKVIEDAKISVD